MLCIWKREVSKKGYINVVTLYGIKALEVRILKAGKGLVSKDMQINQKNRHVASSGCGL